MADVFDKYSHRKSTAHPMIYAYQDTNPIYQGLLKVGYTDKNIDDRVAAQYPTLRPGAKKPYHIVYRQSALYPDGSNFTDHEVHNQLKARGFNRLPDERGHVTEFFKCTVADVAAVYAVQTHSTNLENRTKSFKMRPEQQAAVEKTKRYFQSEIAIAHTAKFLWNCKMRFGKTFAAYELAKSMNMKRILVLTFKPAVEDSWESDLSDHVDFEGWQFYSRKTELVNGTKPSELKDDQPIVCFGSFQDFLGTSSTGGIKAKNKWVHKTKWDLVIFDEYHFGAWRDSVKKLFEEENDDNYDSLNIEEYKRSEADNVYNESILPITTDAYLFLSGTPFRSLNSGEFLEDQIYSWTYSDEQREKANWDTKKGKNPYAALPRMVMMAYKMPEELERVAKNGDLNEFNLNVFFSARLFDGDLDSAEFIYKDEVQKWLDMIRGNYMPMSIDNLQRHSKDKPVMPFSDARMLANLSHTVWFLPNVSSCYAMKNLLSERQNVFYHDYKINLCAGSKAGVGLEAVEPVRKSMMPALETRSITLTCGKLTTGVTIRPWSGIFMLRNLSSPETYFQAAFRVQSPWTVTREDGTNEILKQECYVFDFAVNRALREISDYSIGLNIAESNPEKKVDEFIHFLPVLAFDGSTMTAVDASSILDIVTAGTSATLLARKWESALLVNVDNDTLNKLLSNPDALSALMSIEGFRNLNDDIETIINKSNNVRDAKKNGSEKNSASKKELTEEEKEYRSKRKEIQEKLIKFATRIPIFMYLTDYRENSLKDIITRIEPNLFRKVTGLKITDFNLLVSLGLFNSSLMDQAVYQFRRYEETSLDYTGISKHSPNERVGLYDTVVTREEYEALAKKQDQSEKLSHENHLTFD